MAGFRNWLGEGRFRLLVGLLIVTGITSTLLQSFLSEADWLASAQTALVVIFLGGAIWIISGALSPLGQRRMLFTALPAVGALGLAILLPSFLPLFIGGAIGWLIGSQMLLRKTENSEYKQAIKAMRKKNYAEAIDAMSQLIKREPKVAQHYGFRAQLYRLNNDMRRARKDYEKVIALEPDSSLGANGMAEVSLQAGDLDEARKWGALAYKTAPKDWVAAYNYGMILERRAEDDLAIQHLKTALGLRIPDSRHRLLTRLWLARAYHRQGKTALAEEMAEELRMEKKGLKEWGIILESEEAKGLRQLLQEDVRLAGDLVNGSALDAVFSDMAQEVG